MTAATLTLTEFLLARIAEDEVVARDWSHNQSKVEIRGGGTGYRSLVSPARVLAECEAKRRIVELHTPLDGEECCPSCGDLARYCQTLPTLVAVYVDHPDYCDEWRT